MAATTESIPQAQVTSTFWKSAQSFQREFLNLMSFGYLDDDAGVFAQDSQHATNIGAASEAAVKVKDDILAAAESSKGVGNVFTYITSPWAVVCLFMVCSHAAFISTFKLRIVPYKMEFAFSSLCDGPPELIVSHLGSIAEPNNDLCFAPSSPSSPVQGKIPDAHHTNPPVSSPHLQPSPRDALSV